MLQQRIVSLPLERFRLGKIHDVQSWKCLSTMRSRGFNMDESVEGEIYRIWGNTAQAQKILEVIERRNIDFFKLMDCFRNKRQDHLSGMGAVLGLDEMFSNIVQCQCGEVMGFHDEQYEKMMSSSNGRILCKRCDPSFLNKLFG